MTLPDPWAIGRSHELSASGAQRTARGAWYTPRPAAEAIAALVFDGPGDANADWLPTFVVDPTCGGGAFLLASLDQMVARGCEPSTALGRVAGIDIDPGAVEACRAALDAWAESHGIPRGGRVGADAADLRSQIVVGDALSGWPGHWPEPDVVIGNPPFATPLKQAALPPEAVAYREANADVLGPYADLAAIHLLNAVERVREGGRISLVLPQSLLAGRDAAALRSRVNTVAPPWRMWATGERIFDANVRVFAPLLQGGGHTPATPWSELVAEELGAPPVSIGTSAGTLAELVTATAGFRDEYYGLAAACEEGSADDRRPRLATVGSIDPLESFWGERPTTFAKRRWDRPVVDLDRLPPSLEAWSARQLQPKILLPTQSKVFEPFVDRSGAVLPVTPLLSIHAAPGDLDRVAAVLLAPPVVAFAYRRWFGTALSVKAIKLAAQDVGSLPLPIDRGRWDEATSLVAAGPAALPDIGRLMTDAYGADPGLFEWWSSRL